MRKDLTDITIVIDRSGSMSSCKKDAEGGVNTFIEDQKNQPGSASLTIVQFDSVYEFVCKGAPIKDAPKFTLNPRGSTALLDAIGRAVAETGERLAAMKESDRPGLVIFVILTDGEENSSREFRMPQIKEMIEHQTNKYGWQFVFLGANQDAFSTAGGLGISAANASNYSEQKTSGALWATSNNVSSSRAAVSRGLAPSMGYTDQQRQEMSK